jgi:hypothetical protein
MRKANQLVRTGLAAFRTLLKRFPPSAKILANVRVWISNAHENGGNDSTSGFARTRFVTYYCSDRQVFADWNLEREMQIVWDRGRIAYSNNVPPKSYPESIRTQQL